MDLKIVKVLILLFVFSIVFLAIESKSSSSYGYKKMMSIITNSNRQLTSLGVVRKSSSIATSYIPSSISSPSKKPTRAAYRAPRISNVGDNGDRPFSTHYPSQYIHASFFSTTPLFALNDATRSKAQEISESVTVGANYLPLNAQHWFTQLLPEGWCVGVSNDTSVCDSSLHSTIFLHPDEYQWGVDNIASESSRTSYYLGRMALRLSLDALLQSESMDMDAQEKLKFCTQLKDEIHSIAINKDSYGRPILPGIISGSISHKGGNAVGLARFRSLGDNQHALDNNHFEMMYTSTIKWREECPIYEDDDTYKDATDGISYMSNAVSGIGIDLERIDARRGKRIKRKVLTETEQAELGGLEVRMPLKKNVRISC